MRYNFNLPSTKEEKSAYMIIVVGALALLYGYTMSIAFCYKAAIAGGALFYGHTRLGLTFKRVIKDNLYKLIKNRKLFEEKESKLTYAPEVYYSYDDKFLEIKFRLDGSKFRDDYLDLQSSLEDLFVMDCIGKEQKEGYISYKLDRTSTERLNMSNFIVSSKRVIPINSKLVWDFTKAPHALISGVTGKGKTFFLAYLVKVFNLIGADFKIFDPKMSDLYSLKRLYKDNVVSKSSDIAKTMREVIDLMNDRYNTFINLPNYTFGKNYIDYGFKPLFIIFDEIAAFKASIDSKLAKEIDERLAEIIMKGRQAGIFMILTTQRPDASVIKTDIRDQLGLRIALGEMSKTAYTMIFGSEFNDLELNNSSPGIGFIYVDGVHTKPVKFESTYFNQDYNYVKDLAAISKRG